MTINTDILERYLFNPFIRSLTTEPRRTGLYIDHTGNPAIAILNPRNFDLPESIVDLQPGGNVGTEIDTRTTTTLIKLLKEAKDDAKKINLVIQVSRVFSRVILNQYSWYNTPAKLAGPKQDLSMLLKIADLAERWNIPMTTLLNTSREELEFLAKSDKYGIDSTYFRNCVLPKANDNSLFKAAVSFPVNLGSVTNPNITYFSFDNLNFQSWIHQPNLQYGPYGFRNEEPNENPAALKVFKVVERERHIGAGDHPIHLELVTSAPTYDVVNPDAGFAGHSWLRVYVPYEQSRFVYNENDLRFGSADGRGPDRDLVYSIGYNLVTIPDHDAFEFMPDKLHHRNLRSIHPDQWTKLQTEIEGLRAVLQGLRNPTPEEEASIKALKAGLCANFAARIWTKYTGERINARSEITHRLLTAAAEYIPGSIKARTPEAVNFALGIARDGNLPANMIQKQKQLPSYKGTTYT